MQEPTVPPMALIVERLLAQNRKFLLFWLPDDTYRIHVWGQKADYILGFDHVGKLLATAPGVKH